MEEQEEAELEEMELEYREEVEGSEDLSAQVDQFFTEMELDVSKRRRTLKAIMKGGSRKLPRGSLPPHLRSTMGQANLRVARGELQEAITICMEVIRQAPEAYEPFEALEMIYEEMGHDEKRYQFALIVAHLKPRDFDQWVKVAELAVTRNERKTAIHSYSKALAIRPKEVGILLKKAELHLEVGETQKVLDTYQKVLENLPDTEWGQYLGISLEMAKIYHEMENTQEGIDVLVEAFKKHRQHIDIQAVNMLAELYLDVHDYWSAAECILDFYGIHLPDHVVQRGKSADLSNVQSNIEDIVSTTEVSSAAQKSDQSKYLTVSDMLGQSFDVLNPLGDETEPASADQLEGDIVRCIENLYFPLESPLDLQAKVAVSLIHLYATAPKVLLSALYEADPEKCGDVYLDIAEAFMDVDQYNRAHPLLSILVGTELYSQPGVWLKHAECLHSMGDLESAAASYTKVVELAPHHTEAKLVLATVYGQLGRTEEALGVLGDEDDLMEGLTSEEAVLNHITYIAHPNHLPPTIQELRLSYHKFVLLTTEKRTQEYTDLAMDMIRFLCRDYIFHPNLKVMAHMSQKSVKKTLAESVSTSSKEAKAELTDKEKILTTEEWWNVFKQCCEGLLALKRMNDLYHVVMAANASHKFSGISEDKDKEMIALSFSACFLCKQLINSFTFIKSAIVTEWPMIQKGEKKAFWNYVYLFPPTSNIRRVFIRLLAKDTPLPLVQLLANIAYQGYRYRTAISMYRYIVDSDPKHYIAYFSMALCFVSLVQQRSKVYHPRKNELIAQALAIFNEYAKIRGRCQETMYNIGRLFHQIGLVQFASIFYEQVLVLPREGEDPDSSLHSEAAYNLAQIYRNSGNLPLARHMLRIYCSV